MDKEQPKNTLESLFESTSNYIETRVELAKLKAVKKSSEVASTLISKMIIGGVVFLFLMVFNMAVGFWLGDMLGKNYYGFFVLALFYLVVGIVIYASRDKWLKTPVANSIIKSINE
jgi:Putative Actinobacterial Holin-X, holin superfamily III